MLRIPALNSIPATRLHLWLSILLTALFLLFLLPMGPGITPDSVAYREIALNILHGRGPVNNQGVLVNHWPPLYPAALAFFTFCCGGDIQLAALLLQGLLCFLYLLLLFRISRQIGLTKPGSILLVLLACLTPGMFQFYRQMSEGLFNTLLLALLSAGLDGTQKPRPLLMGLLAGLLFLTRYAGMAFITATGLYLLLISLPDPRRLLRNLSLFAVGPVLAMGGWMLTEYWMQAGHFNRNAVFHPIPAVKWKDLSAQVNTQLFPPLQQLYPYSGLLVLGLFSGFTASWIYRKRNLPEGRQALLFGLSLCAFLALLLITCSYLDAHTPMDARIWSPAAPLVLLLLFLYLQETPPLLRYLIPLVPLGLNLSPAFALWNDVRKNGEGLGARIWRESAVLQAAEAPVKAGKKVYSNGADLLNYYWNADGRRNIHIQPLKYYPTSGIANSAHEREFSQMLSEIRQQKAVFVFFYNIRWRTYLEDSAGIMRRISGSTPTVYHDGLILR